ncbi:uncharacterized protein [Centruroides vittatus]|uniref:uncharacterized protein n=1 Tax=Centruroides vittatus TaxID=120091 RepID=UPI00350FE6C0
MMFEVFLFVIVLLLEVSDIYCGCDRVDFDRIRHRICNNTQKIKAVKDCLMQLDSKMDISLSNCTDLIPSEKSQVKKFCEEENCQLFKKYIICYKNSLKHIVIKAEKNKQPMLKFVKCVNSNYK